MFFNKNKYPIWSNLFSLCHKSDSREFPSDMSHKMADMTYFTLWLLTRDVTGKVRNSCVMPTKMVDWRPFLLYIEVKIERRDYDVIIFMKPTESISRHFGWLKTFHNNNNDERRLSVTSQFRQSSIIGLDLEGTKHNYYNMMWYKSGNLRALWKWWW